MLPKLFFISILSSLIFTHSYNTQCLDDQKSLLLQLKNELIFDSSTSRKLVKWNRRDEYCCNWLGVECDGAGNVISLQLDNEAISSEIGDSSSLFKLKHLQMLNLAYNDFYSSPIPKGIHNLTYLTHLNLSSAGFAGHVPPELLLLRRLVRLDISNNWLSLEHPNLEMLVQNLTGLRELYLDSVNITSSDERRKWSHILSSYLPNLTALSLRFCSLSGPFASSFSQLHTISILQLDYNNLSTQVPADLFAKFSSLSILTLANCGLEGSFPSMIFQIPTLQYIDLSYNYLLSGSIPPFTQTGSLKSIRLRLTNFSGFITSSVSNIKNLSEIDLSSCKFTGPIPSTFANLTRLIYVNLGFNLFTGSLSSTLFEGLSNLYHLDLQHNSFSSNIPYSLFGLPSLKKLWLNHNQFNGQVEEFPVVNVSNIATLDLSRNRLEGPVPDSFFQLRSLKSLLLLGNLFNGTFQLDKIQSLPNLTSLHLSYNKLSVYVKSSTYEQLPQLKELGLASCNLNAFPNFIKHYNMTELDLSYNRITGEIPSWIWGTQLEHLNLSFNLLTNLQKPYHIPASLQLLDLQSNKLWGELHRLIPPNTGNLSSQLEYMQLADNYFSGSIPTSLCSASTNLDFLDLSVNKLSGTIPSCLFENSIQVVDLGRNNISGRIPDNFSPDCDMRYFNLNNNTLHGEIPKSIESCKQLEFMNVGNNLINDTFPCMLPSRLRVLVLHSNRFHGEVRCDESWPDLQILDTSSNNFSGSLKSINFSSWTAMVQARDAQLGRNELSYYSMWSFGVTLTVKGQEGELVKIWPEFTSIDLSGNNFGGEIPNAIGDLSSLYLLNLSHNALNGSIPKTFGQLRKLESLDLSQNQLTGTIPMELAGLTFLSFLNLSYNKLDGVIPKGSQFQTFSADSFERNSGLCGFPLNISCSDTDNDNDLTPRENGNVEEKKREIEWEYVCAALGYVVGLGSIVWLLVFCRSFRKKYFDKIDEVVEEIFDARDMRRRRRQASARRRVVRNRQNR